MPSRKQNSYCISCRLGWREIPVLETETDQPWCIRRMRPGYSAHPEADAGPCRVAWVTRQTEPEPVRALCLASWTPKGVSCFFHYQEEASCLPGRRGWDVLIKHKGRPVMAGSCGVMSGKGPGLASGVLGLTKDEHLIHPKPSFLISKCGWHFIPPRLWWGLSEMILECPAQWSAQKRQARGKVLSESDIRNKYRVILRKTEILFPRIKCLWVPRGANHCAYFSRNNNNKLFYEKDVC